MLSRVATVLLAAVATLRLSLGSGLALAPSRRTIRMGSSLPASTKPKKLVVLGGTGFVGSEVCKIAVDRGFAVTSLSRRGENPAPNDALLSQVNFQQGDATDPATVSKVLAEADAVVHAVGLLFDVESGLANLSPIVSGSGSVPGSESTYDNITRRTAENAIAALKARLQLPFMSSGSIPFAFVSCAEAGWPDVALGDKVEEVAPDWLKKYLAAKRTVEGQLNGATDRLRPILYRPSLIWNWSKLDVLPVIPIFNIANALGVPFVDKTVRVETLAAAIVAGLEDETIAGVQRFSEMENLADRLQ